ncbi:MAG: TolC family protein [Acidobacteriota bacterium]
MRSRCAFPSACLFLLMLAPRPVVSAELTMTEAIQQAQATHASIDSARAQIQGAEGLQKQAALRPNPTLNFQSENWRVTAPPSFVGARDLDLFAFVAQPLETAGKRSRRMAVAAQTRRIADLKSEAVMWSIRQRVKQDFLRALLAQQQVQLLEENSRTFDQIVEYHRNRVELGAMAEADLIRVQLEADRFHVALRSAAMDSERALVELLRSMGRPDPPNQIRLAEVPMQRPSDGGLGLDDILEMAHRMRLEVQVHQSRVGQAESQLDLQRAQAKPDWTAIFGYKRTTGLDTLIAGLSVPLPLFNRNQGNIAFEQSEVQRARAELRLTLRDVDAEVRSALAGLRRRYQMLRELQDGILARAEESWRIAQAAYRVGGSDLLRLLDAQRARNEIQLLHARTQREYQLSLVELESAVGAENLSLREETLLEP